MSRSHLVCRLTDISLQNWVATIYSALWLTVIDSCNGGRDISMGPVHGEGSREKKLKHDGRSVRGVRVSMGRFVWL